MQYADTILAELYYLATKAKSEKVRLDASTYLINRAAGTPIAKVETREVSDKDKNKEGDKELTWEDLEQNEISPSNDKVIDLKNRQLQSEGVYRGSQLPSDIAKNCALE